MLPLSAKPLSVPFFLFSVVLPYTALIHFPVDDLPASERTRMAVATVRTGHAGCHLIKNPSQPGAVKRTLIVIYRQENVRRPANSESHLNWAIWFNVICSKLSTLR